MITTEHLIVETEQTSFGALHLAPFAEPDMVQHVPLSEAFTQYNPPSSFEDLDTAEAYFAEDRDDEGFLAWGMYVGSVATKNFVGTIGTSASNVGAGRSLERCGFSPMELTRRHNRGDKTEDLRYITRVV